eukprot:1144704-Pelagomonas_calceolata.AAC.6
MLLQEEEWPLECAGGSRPAGILQKGFTRSPYGVHAAPGGGCFGCVGSCGPARIAQRILEGLRRSEAENECRDPLQHHF